MSDLDGLIYSIIPLLDKQNKKKFNGNKKLTNFQTGYNKIIISNKNKMPSMLQVVPNPSINQTTNKNPNRYLLIKQVHKL
jgi:hypothetical protein